MLSSHCTASHSGRGRAEPGCPSWGPPGHLGGARCNLCCPEVGAASSRGKGAAPAGLLAQPNVYCKQNSGVCWRALIFGTLSAAYTGLAGIARGKLTRTPQIYGLRLPEKAREDTPFSRDEWGCFLTRMSPCDEVLCILCRVCPEATVDGALPWEARSVLCARACRCSDPSSCQ